MGEEFERGHIQTLTDLEDRRFFVGNNELKAMNHRWLYRWGVVIGGLSSPGIEFFNAKNIGVSVG